MKKDVLGLDEVKIHYSSWALIRDLGQLVYPHSFKFFAATVLRLIGDTVWLYPAFALAGIVTFFGSYKVGDPLDALWVIVLLWAAAIVVRNACHFISKYLGYQLSERASIDITLKALQHLFLLDMAWHEREHSGNKLKRIQNAASGVGKIIRIWFLVLIGVGVNFVGIALILSQFDWVVLVFLAGFIVVYFFLSFIFTHRAATASYLVNEHEEEVNALMFEAINNIRTLKVMGMASALYRIVSAESERLFSKISVREFRYQVSSSSQNVLAGVFQVGVIAYIIVGISHGSYEVGFLILFIGYFDHIWQSVAELTEVTQEFVTAKFSIARMQTILDEPIVIANEEGKVALPDDWSKITFNNVSFAYGKNQVLNNLSFEIQRGDRVGIVGLSGAGKSTLFKLLLKEREEFTGDILFDDVSIRDIKATSYFSQVSPVLQDTEVFNLSLKENITITNPNAEADARQLASAMETAHVTDFIHKLPQGVNTIIGEKGVKLSGGERQRLGIARAVFKQPKLLLLDEATSHLDSESEEKIRDSLNTFFGQVTAIVIAHRLSTIRAMNKILVIENGTLIEEGSFDDLYAKKGRFFELWEKQKI